MRIIKVKPVEENSFVNDYDNDNFVKSWPISKYEELDCCFCPIQELAIEKGIRNYNCHNNIVNYVKMYMSTKVLKHTDWIDCVGLKNYYYFVDNFGSNDVDLCIEISPDRNMALTESGPFKLSAGKILYLQPMRDSRFVRLSYVNQELKSCNPIKVWLQGKR